MKIVNDPYGEFCGQHAAHILDNGNLFLFDNGVACVINPRTGVSVRPSNQFSRAVEYALDPENGEAIFQRHHSLRGEFNRLGYASGHVEELGNGDWLVSWGRAPGSGPRNRLGIPTSVLDPDDSLTQVDPNTGAEKFRIDIVTPTSTSQRMRAIPLTPVALAAEIPPLTATILDNGNGASDTPTALVAFNQPVVDFTATSPSISVTGATVASVSPHVVDGAPANAYIVTLTPAGGEEIIFNLDATQSCASDGICTAGGATLSVAPTPITVPEQVGNLGANAPSSTRIDLSWTRPAADSNRIQRYELQRKTGGSYSTVAAALSATGTAYQDRGLSSSTTYTYRIRAVNSIGVGPWSAERSATTGAPPPQQVETPTPTPTTPTPTPGIRTGGGGALSASAPPRQDLP